MSTPNPSDIVDHVGEVRQVSVSADVVLVDKADWEQLVGLVTRRPTTVDTVCAIAIQAANMVHRHNSSSE